MEKYKKRIKKIIKRKFWILIFISIFITEIIPYWFMCFYLGRWGLDVHLWNEIGKSILQGKMPYRDFIGSYSPLYPLLLAFSFLILNHFSAPVLIFIVFSFLSTCTFYKIAEIEFCTKKELITILFLLNPSIWIFTAFYCQEEIISAFFILLSYYFWIKKSEMKTFISLAFGYLFTKLTFLIFFPVFLIYSSKKVRNLLLLTLIISVPYIFLLLNGVDVFYPIKYEKNRIEEISIIGLIKDLTYYDLPFILNISLLLGALAFIYLFIIINKKKLNILNSLISVSLIFLFFGWKSLAFYRLALLLPLLFIWFVKNNQSLSSFLLYSFSLVIFRLTNSSIPFHFHEFEYIVFLSSVIAIILKIIILVFEFNILVKILKNSNFLTKNT